MKELKIDKNLIINTIMNNSQDTIYIKDKESAVIWSSKSHSLLWGVKNPLEVIGKTDYDYFPKEFAEIAYQEEQEIMRSELPVIGKVEKLVRPSGKTIWLSVSKYPFYNEEGEVIGTWGTSSDITCLKEVEQKLQNVNKKLEEANKKLQILCVRDCLSGLYNRRCFYEELEKTFNLYIRQSEKDKDKDFTVIFIDIDNFKIINDGYGHLAGDYAIQHLAQIMIANVRSSDTCFRYGGDEFAVLLLDTHIKEAIQVARKLRQKIEDTPICYKGDEIAMTTSMGMASFSHSTSVEDIIHQADANLYRSKASGKNMVC